MSDPISFYDNGRIVPDLLRDEIRRQQSAAAGEWTTTGFQCQWHTAHDFVHLAETLARYSVITCRECGARYDTASTAGGVRLAHERLCFTCNFWLEKVEWAESDTSDARCPVARIGGRHYVVAPDQSDKGASGFGGLRSQVRWVSGPRTGESVVTTNLWTQGEIPAMFRGRLPDNAEFVHAVAVSVPEPSEGEK